MKTIGFFDTIRQPIVLSIAAGHVFIALSMFLKKHWFRAGCLGGIFFCLSIDPLGLGAAFHGPLLLALAFYRLFTHEYHQPLAHYSTLIRRLVPWLKGPQSSKLYRSRQP